MCNLRSAQPGDQAAITDLLDKAFGPGRLALSAYRLREGNPPLDELGVVAIKDERLVGSIQFSPVSVGDDPALLLGPLAVDPCIHGTGIGLALLEAGLAACREHGHERVILVGDEPYYSRVGFGVIPQGQVSFPGPVDANRLLGLSLSGRALQEFRGPVRAVRVKASV